MKKETLEEAACKHTSLLEIRIYTTSEIMVECFKRGAKWQLKNLTKKDLIKLPLVEEIILNFLTNFVRDNYSTNIERGVHYSLPKTEWRKDFTNLLVSDVELFQDYKQSILKEK